MQQIIPPEAIQSWANQCSPQHLSAIGQDMQAIFQQGFQGKFPAAEREKPLYIATAGAPASGKSTLLTRELNRFGDQRITHPAYYPCCGY
jgi:pantothenate kinase